MRLPLAALLTLLALPAFGETGRSGVWTYVYEPSSSGPGGLFTALSPAPAADHNDPSQIVARCYGGRPEFLVGGAGGWGMPRRTLAVTISIDGGPPQTSRWDVSTNGRAVFLDDGVEAFLKRLPDDGELRVEVVDAVGQTRANRFATKGFAAVRARLAQACGWKD